MESRQLDHAQRAEASLFARLQDPCRLRFQVWISERNVIVQKNRRADEVLEVEL